MSQPKRGAASGNRVTVERRSIGLYAEPPHHDWHEIEIIDLESPGGVGVSVSTLGASIISVRVPDRSDHRSEIVIGPTNLTEAVALAPHYMGVTMGRFARIVSRAQFSLDGDVYHLTANSGPHHIHGGAIGFDRLVWTSAMQCDATRSSAVLRLTRPDGDEGYPGQIEVVATFTLDPNGVLMVDYQARTQSPTIVGLTNHTFWDLSASRRLDEHVMQIEADRYVEVDQERVPTGQLLDVEETAFDFRTPRRLLNRKIDACFALTEEARGFAGRHHAACELSHSQSGRRLRIVTNQPCLAVYTGDGLPEPRAGICIQASPMPDAPNQPRFERSRLDPGNVYESWTVFHLSFD